MFHVQTYIYLPRKKNPSLPPVIPVDDTNTLRKAEPYLDIEYLEGYIELSYYGQPILTNRLGDFIISYWDYLFQAIVSFLEEGSGGMYLPDQPIPIEIERQGSNWVLMTVGEGGEYGKWLLPKEELINALLDGAIHFNKCLFEAFSDTVDQKYRFKNRYEGLIKFKKQCFGN